MTMKIKKERHTRYLILAACLVICLSVVSVITSKYISDLTISACYRQLKDYTSQYAVDIRQDVEADAKLLEGIAARMADRGADTEESRKLLALWEAGTMLDGLGLILADGQVYANHEAFLENLKAIPYEETAVQGEHMSKRTADSGKTDKWYLYHFVPVLKEGKAEGILCGIIDLKRLSRRYVEQLGDGTRIHLMEGRSGDFLIDTVHPELVNAEDFRGRRVKKGYRMEDALKDITGGQAGETAFFSTTAREYLYCVYEPVGVNDWMIMLGQPESMAFRDARNMRVILQSLVVAESAIFIIYLLAAFFWTRRSAKEKEKELDRVQYILQVEEILFNAASKPDRIEAALREVAERLSADFSFLIIYDETGNERMYTWKQEGMAAKKSYAKSDFPILCTKLLSESGIISYDMKELVGDADVEVENLKGLGITSLMVIPLKEPENAHVGSLGAANMHQKFHTTELLQCVMLSFSMAVKNIESFREIVKMGTRDNLTGLKNRNCYQHDLLSYEKDQDRTLSCIYVDADGLHNINNKYGHEAGDRLLQTVAKILKEEFGEEGIYRVGGDEFVAFSRGIDKEQLEEKTEKTKKRVEGYGYHISVGNERREADPFVYGMIKHAETKMFEAKRKYHEAMGDMVEMRELNRKLEETLMEKRNLDVFRAVLSSKYLGVYIVNLSMDTFRSIYIPSYFDDAAERSGGKFSEAVKIYVRTYVCEEHHKSFMRLLDYQSIEDALNCEENPELLYARPDGMRILLRIYLSPDYDKDCKECIWTFEKLET